MTDVDYIQPASEWVRDQLAAIDAAGTTRAVHVQGRPVVVVTMRGARSGRLRRVPLMRVEHGGRYLAVGSKGGAPRDPVWVRNLLAHPDVAVMDGDRTSTGLRARLLDGAEREEWWARAVAAFPSYRDYQARTARTIPLFVLEPAPH